jgi:hypothetical protein
MSLKKRLLFTTVLLLTVVIIYSSLWGRLFPFSPIVLGFEKREFNKTLIYHRPGTDISKIIKIDSIDSIINGVENFHQLKFKRKVKIFIFNSDKDYARRTGTRARFVTFPLYGRIFVSGKAKKESEEGNIHLDIYLRHELSHSLLYHNMSLCRSQYYPGWLLEGIAVYSANQMGVDGYFTKEETFDKIKEGYFLNPDDWSTTLLKPQSENVKNFPLPNKYWFIYSEFACLVDDIIQNYGKEKFLQYMTVLLEEKDDKKAFKRIFGIEFNEYVNDFENRVGYKATWVSHIRPSNFR